MGVGAEEETYNDAVDVLLVAWEAVIDALAANEETQIVWLASKKGDDTADTTHGADTTATYDFGRRFYYKNQPNTTDKPPLEIGGKPLFFKITNGAGDLTT